MVKQLIEADRYESMRGWFAYELHKHMIHNQNIWLVTGDLGYGMFDKIKEDFPERYVNAGASEQAMVGLSVGLAYGGKLPVVYSITPFLLYRPFETIRNYINHESIPIIMVGSGRNRDYQDDGFSHWAEEDKDVLRIFSNFLTFRPENKEEIPTLVEHILSSNRPCYLNLTR